MSDFHDLAEFVHVSVVDQTGAKVGKVSDVYVDEQGEETVWLQIHRGHLSRSSVWMPLAGAVVQDGELVTTYAEELVLDSPDLEPGKTHNSFSSDSEQVLYRHYGLNYFQGGLTGAPEVSAVGEASDHESSPRLRRFDRGTEHATGVPVESVDAGEV